MTGDLHIRLIDLRDAGATLDIYRPYVQQTAVSFEYEVPALREWESRIETTLRDFPYLVCTYKDRIAGYAYAGRHRQRMAYAWSAESTIYLSAEFHGLGIAGVLYACLFDLLQLQGYVNVFAGVTIPNAKSEAFHQRMGFREVGVYKKVGYKLGGWHDVRWYQRPLAEYPGHPERPAVFHTVQNASSVTSILGGANTKLTTERK